MSVSDAKDRVKEATDIVEVASRYLRLKKSGKRFVALCPFHREKAPSFSINPVGQFYHCFGCGKSGDVYSLVMEMEGMTFPEALAFLAERVGIDVRSTGDFDAERARQLAKGRADLMGINAAAERYYHRMLFEEAGKQALDYMKGRGFSDETLSAFGIGYAPNEWDALIRYFDAKGVKRGWLVSGGLAREGADGSVRDYFRNRLMFPVRNAEGRVIAFGARALSEDDQPKYLNSPDTPVFKKSRTLFGLDLARKEIGRRNTALVMEGYTDVMMAHQGGLEHVVATLGTAFSSEAAEILQRLAETVVVVFDGDEAGRQAARRALSVLLGPGVVPKLLLLPPEHDPCSYILENGGEAFAALVQEGAVDGFRWLLDETVKGTDMSSAHERARAARELAEFAGVSTDILLKQSLLDTVADTFRVSRALVAEAASGGPALYGDATTGESAEKEETVLGKARSWLVASMLEHPEELPLLGERLDLSYWPSDIVELTSIIGDEADASGLQGEELAAHLMSKRNDLSAVLMEALGKPGGDKGRNPLISAAIGYSRALLGEMVQGADEAGKFEVGRKRQELKTIEGALEATS